MRKKYYIALCLANLKKKKKKKGASDLNPPWKCAAGRRAGMQGEASK